MTDSVRLHIGGTQPKEGWKILNIMPGPDVDIIGSCTDLSIFGDGAVDEVYASHVLEHLDAKGIYEALNEIARILKPGGAFKGSVPDMNVLCRLYLEAADDPGLQIRLTHVIYGGHLNEFDVHHFGFSFPIMAALLAQAGFTRVDQVELLGEFEDTSTAHLDGTLISLNFIARK